MIKYNVRSFEVKSAASVREELVRATATWLRLSPDGIQASPVFDEWAATLEPRVPRPDADPFGCPEAVFDHYRDLVAFDLAGEWDVGRLTDPQRRICRKDAVDQRDVVLEITVVLERRDAKLAELGGQVRGREMRDDELIGWKKLELIVEEVFGEKAGHRFLAPPTAG